MFHTSSVTVYPNGCMLTSYGNGAAYSLKYKEYDGWVEQETAFLQRDLQVWEFERLLDECNNDDDVFALFQKYHYGELPTDYDVLAYEESIPIDGTEQTEHREDTITFDRAFDDWQNNIHYPVNTPLDEWLKSRVITSVDYCSDHCDNCAGEYHETFRNEEYLIGPFMYNDMCVCNQCRDAMIRREDIYG